MNKKESRWIWYFRLTYVTDSERIIAVKKMKTYVNTQLKTPKKMGVFKKIRSYFLTVFNEFYHSRFPAV